MWMSSLSNRLARLVLSACLALTATSAWGSVAVKTRGIPVAAKVGLAAQGGRRESAQPKTPIVNHVDDDYIIGASDVLDINVWKDPELTQKVPVRPDGRITLPLIGEIQVSGLTAMNVQLLITQKLSEFIAKPIVAVSVTEMKSRTYTIVGKIIRPGSYDLGKPTTVLEAIAIAGGFVDFAKTNKVYILRRQGDGSELRLPFNYKKVIDQKAQEENVNLKNGDTIVVP
jgi:polysaccharide export outer membrane protein